MVPLLARGGGYSLTSQWNEIIGGVTTAVYLGTAKSPSIIE